MYTILFFIFSIIFIIFSGISESIMDKIQFHFSKSIFSKFKNQLFWDPSISWRNKYKMVTQNKVVNFGVLQHILFLLPMRGISLSF